MFYGFEGLINSKLAKYYVLQSWFHGLWFQIISVSYTISRVSDPSQLHTTWTITESYMLYISHQFPWLLCNMDCCLGMQLLWILFQSRPLWIPSAHPHTHLFCCVCLCHQWVDSFTKYWKSKLFLPLFEFLTFIIASYLFLSFRTVDGWIEVTKYHQCAISV